LLLALLVSGFLYGLIQAVSIAALPALASAHRPLVDVAAALMGPWGALLLTAAIIVSVGANLLGTMFSTPRMTYRLALDGQLPQCFGTVHKSFNTPIWSIVFFGATGFVLAATGSFAWLAGLSVVTRIPVYLCCVGAIPRLTKRFATRSGTLKLPGGYTFPLMAAAVCIWLMTQVSAPSYASAAALIAVGWVLYIASQRPNKPPYGDARTMETPQ